MVSRLVGRKIQILYPPPDLYLSYFMFLPINLLTQFLGVQGTKLGFRLS